MITEDTAYINMKAVEFGDRTQSEMVYISDYGDMPWVPNGSLAEATWECVNHNKSINPDLFIKTLCDYQKDPCDVRDFLKVFNAILAIEYREWAPMYYKKHDFTPSADATFLFRKLYIENAKKLIQYILLCRPYINKQEE